MVEVFFDGEEEVGKPPPVVGVSTIVSWEGYDSSSGLRLLPRCGWGKRFSGGCVEDGRPVLFLGGRVLAGFLLLLGIVVLLLVVVVVLDGGERWCGRGLPVK